jgi:hypothetical protein
MNVLLLSYGNESSIEIAKSINELTNHVVYGCHWDTTNAGRAYLNKNYIFTTPNPFRDGPTAFFDVVNDIISDCEVDLVYVTNCKLLKLVEENYESIAYIKKLLIPDKEALRYCLYKDELYRRVPEYSPEIYDSTAAAVSAGVDKVFIKPKYGSSGDGAYICDDLTQIDKLGDDCIACEFLPGEEFTVDCVSDADGRLRDFNPRVRTRTRDGICNYGQSSTLYYDEIKDALARITRKVKLPYHWFAQFKIDSAGNPKLLEVNCRISGSFCITKSSRKDYVKWFLQDFDSSAVVLGPSKSSHSLTRHMGSYEVGKKSYVVDIDGTLCTETGGNYLQAIPLYDNITSINELYETGVNVILHTARGMKRFNNDVAAVYENLYSLTTEQLTAWGVKYDKLILGKPVGTYVDEDALTISGLKEMLLKQ